MNTESTDCRKVAGFDQMEKPGDFYFDPRDDHEGIVIILPGQTFVHLAVNRGAPAGARVWGWDGNEEKPTITPSIHALEHWHGYMTQGRLVSC
jgi:hypothetical protein